MIQSGYNLAVEDGFNSVILFNTVSKAVVRVEREIFNLLEQNRIDELTEEDIQDLSELGFIVDTHENENKRLLEEAISKSSDSTHFDLHLLPTMGCNFRCIYCFQTGVESCHFVKEDIPSLLNPLKKYLLESNVKTFSFILYGGEPTLNWNFTLEYANNLFKFLKSHGISYDTQIITNGYNLGQDKLTFLKEHNCHKMQITLDGTREMHDSRRCLSNGLPTFDRIIKNMHIALDNNYIEKITVRLNYDRQNLSSQVDLIDYLKNEFGTERILLSLGWVTDTSKEPLPTMYIHGDAICNLEHIDAYLCLYSKAKLSGFSMKNYFVMNGICIAKRKQSIMLCPDGHYYKCGGMVGRSECSVGKIGDEFTFGANFYPELYNYCFKRKCELIPLCHTGCRLESYHLNGKWDGVDCKYDFLKEMNKRILKHNYSCSNNTLREQ